jgi:hypothetical protein
MNLRFSILWLMALVLLVAVGFAALGNPTELWASAIFTLTVGLLCYSVVGAMFLRGRRRAYWGGFATFGWVYLILVFNILSAKTGLESPPLLTTRLLAYVDRALHPPATASERLYEALINPPNFTTSPVGMPMTVSLSLSFYQIGHSLAALVVALIGSVVARIFAAQEEG